MYCFLFLFSNIAQVSGGERELRSNFLKPFNRACVNSLSIMTAYSSYDGIPAIANTRTFLKFPVF
jgi:beta-glucosidase